MRTVLSAISNLNIPPNARRLRQLPEFIACVLSEYALSSQCSCDVPDSALSAIQRYFDGELPAAKLIDKLQGIEDIAGLYEQFPPIGKDGSYRFSEWDAFMRASEWAFDGKKSELTLNGRLYEMTPQLLILDEAPEHDGFIVRRYSVDAQGNACYVRIGSGDAPIPAPRLPLFAPATPKDAGSPDAAEIEIDEEEFFSLCDTVRLADEQQRDAITSDIDKNLVILAGAGSGKTRTLVCRLAYLHLVRKIPLSEILLLTFTTSAASEMRKRSKELIEPIYARFNPFVKAAINARTIDSFVISLIDTHYAQMGFTQKPVKCLDDSEEFRRERLQMLEEVIRDNRLTGVFRYYFDASGHAKENFPRLMDNLMQCACGLPVNCAGFETLLQLYLDKQRACNKVMGFPEASLFVRDAVNQPDSPLRSAIAQRYSCILIDEFQDISVLQNSIFEPLYSSRIHFTFVGDDDQSIYFWRGSDNSIIRQLLTQSDTRSAYLLTNYRNNPNIVEVGNTILGTIKDRAKSGKPIRPHRTAGAKIRVSTYDGKYTNLVNEIGKLLRSGQPAEEICILSRNSSDGRQLAKALTAADIPVARDAAQVDINDNYKLLKAIINILNGSDMTVSVKEIIRITGRTDVTERHVQKIVTGKCSEIDCEEELLPVKKLSDELRQNVITDLADAVNRYSIKAGELYDSTLYGRASDGVFEAFETFCSNNSVPWPVPRGQLKELFLVFEAGARRGRAHGAPLSSGVRISTIHKAKGLEYNVVIITGLSEGAYPGTGQIDTICAVRSAQLNTFKASRETYYSLKSSVPPELPTALMQACDEPSFSQREKSGMEALQSELYGMKAGIAALSADGVSDYLDAYRYYVEPLIDQYTADICEQNKALLVEKSKIEPLRDEIFLIGQEDPRAAAQKQRELSILEARAGEIEASIERLKQKKARFFKAIHPLSDFNTVCLNASGLLADMEKAEEIETLQEQLREEREQRINEERRLFYVAVTRARDLLYLCYENGTTPSEFIRIIPDGLKEDRVMLTHDEELEYERLTSALHREISRASVNEDTVGRQTDELLGQEKFGRYILKRSSEFLLEHPVFARLSPAAKRYYDKAVGLLFISELTGGEFKTEFAHNMQRMAETVLWDASGKDAVPFKTQDPALAERIVNDIRTVSRQCVIGRPAARYLTKLLTEDDPYSDELKTLKSAGIMHFIVRSGRYGIAPAIADTWDSSPLASPDDFLVAALDLSSTRNALIHKDPAAWPSDPIPLILANAETLVTRCRPALQDAPRKAGADAASAEDAVRQPLTAAYISVGTKVQHSIFGRGMIVLVLSDTFTVDFSGTRKAFLKSSAEKVFTIL